MRLSNTRYSNVAKYHANVETASAEVAIEGMFKVIFISYLTGSLLFVLVTYVRSDALKWDVRYTLDGRLSGVGTDENVRKNVHMGQNIDVTSESDI